MKRGTKRTPTLDVRLHLSRPLRGCAVFEKVAVQIVRNAFFYDGTHCPAVQQFFLTLSVHLAIVNELH